MFERVEVKRASIVIVSWTFHVLQIAVFGHGSKKADADQQQYAEAYEYQLLMCLDDACRLNNEVSCVSHDPSLHVR